MKPLLAIALFAAGAAAADATGTVTVVTRDPAGKPVADAVAYLTPLGAPARVEPPAGPVAIVQRDQEFTPYVTAVVVGTKVVFPNEDTVRHHVYSVSPAKRFEIPLYIGDSKETIVFDKEGIVTLGCNIHDWMVAYVAVLATPYYAKTGADGSAEVRLLPAGRYRLDVWHPRAGTVTREVEVADAADTTQIISVVLRPDRRIRRAPDAGGPGYK
jgi:plastocyanin